MSSSVRLERTVQAPLKICIVRIDVDTHPNEHNKIGEWIFLEGFPFYLKDVESKRKKCAELWVGLVGNMYPIPDQEIKIYIERVLESFDDAAKKIELGNQWASKAGNEYRCTN